MGNGKKFTSQNRTERSQPLARHRLREEVGLNGWQVYFTSRNIHTDASK
jgi:hypothetical protein